MPKKIDSAAKTATENLTGRELPVSPQPGVSVVVLAGRLGTSTNRSTMPANCEQPFTYGVERYCSSGHMV